MLLAQDGASRGSPIIPLTKNAIAKSTYIFLSQDVLVFAIPHKAHY